MKIKIRPYRSSDNRYLTDIFYDTIHKVATEYYTQEQVQAWAPLPKDYPFWQQRLENKPPFVAEIDQTIVGFITLEDSGHIDWTYTHKDYQKLGIASALYNYLEQVAKKQSIKRLFVEASFLARPFFTKQGFSIIKQNDSEKDGQILTNWSMAKVLTLD